MKRSHTVRLTLVASVAAILTSCDQRPTRYCVDGSQTVADDQNCESNNPHYHWYYLRGHGSVGNGTHLSGGTVIPPARGYAARSPSESTGEAEGGTVRGGIGAAGEAASGHGGEGGGE